MIIRGANLGEHEVKFRALSKWKYFDGDLIENNKILEDIEQIYLKNYKKSKEIDVKPMLHEEGKVLIKPGMVNHSCSSHLDSLSSISKLGILASEWFGKPESEAEGLFCVFLDRIHEETNSQAKHENIKTMKGKADNSQVVLFFDDEHPVMKDLLHLDYFEYEKIKQLQPEMLDEIYTEEEKNIFDNIIEPYSEFGAHFHVTSGIPYCDWSAIPGGIPPFLVNGICIGQMESSKEYLEQISSFFPNATIFDSERNIVKMPLKEITIKLESVESIAQEMKYRDIKNGVEEMNNNYNREQSPNEVNKDTEERN